MHEGSGIWSQFPGSASVYIVDISENCPPQQRAAATMATASLLCGFVEGSPSRALRDGEGTFPVMLSRLGFPERIDGAGVKAPGQPRGVPTAVDKQRMAGDEIRGGTCQEKSGADQIGRLRKPPELDPAEQSLRARFIFTECSGWYFL